MYYRVFYRLINTWPKFSIYLLIYQIYKTFRSFLKGLKHQTYPHQKLKIIYEVLTLFIIPLDKINNFFLYVSLFLILLVTILKYNSCLFYFSLKFRNQFLFYHHLSLYYQLYCYILQIKKFLISNLYIKMINKQLVNFKKIFLLHK